MTLTLIAGLNAAPAWAETPSAARVDAALTYLRGHVSNFAEPTDLRDLTLNLANYTAIAGMLTFIGGMVAPRFTNSHRFTGLPDHLTNAGFVLNAGGLALYTMMLFLPDSSMSQVRLRKRAVRWLLSEPPERVRAKFNAYPDMAEWIVQLADNLRAQDELWYQRPVAAAPR